MRGGDQADRHANHPGFEHGPRAEAVHPPAQERAQQRGEDEAEGKGGRGGAAVPAELVDDRREEERERRARIDADRHGDERDSDDHPAVE